MQGIEIKQKRGFYRMRIGSANKRFKLTLLFFSILTIIALAYWLYREIPDNSRRFLTMSVIYFTSAVLYINPGVWLHEQLHCLGFLGADKDYHAKITYIRKYMIILSGYYRVTGSLPYPIMRRALLGPALFVFLSIAAGWIGNFFLPGWWLPLCLTMAVVGVIDMTTDLYWYLQIRKIAEKGKYWDKGRELHIVWKQ